MSLEMSKFFAGVHGMAAIPPYAVGHYKLSTLHHQGGQKKKREILPTANKRRQKSLVVSGNRKGVANAAIGLPRKRTPTGLTGPTYGSAETVPSIQKRWTKGKIHLSEYKNSDGTGASAIKSLRKQIKHQHPPTQCQLLRKSLSNSKCRRPSPGTCRYLCGPLDGPPGIKWIMRPARNFKSSSDSSSEDNKEFITLKCMGKLEITSPNLTVKTSWPDDIRPRRRARANDRYHTDMNPKASKHSRFFCVPSQRILLVDQLKQAQMRQVKARRVRSQHKEEQQIKQSIQKPNWQSLPPKASLLLTDDVVETTSVHNSETAQMQLGHDTLTITTAGDLVHKDSSNSSNGSYQTTIVCSSTSCHQSDSIGKMWSSDQKYDNPIVQHNGKSKSIKLTSTVIKIIPETAEGKTPEPALSVRPQVHAAVRQLLQLPKRVTIATTHASPTQLVTTHHQQHQPQPVCLLESPTFAPIPKIIRVEQHKIPRTMEDGIDMSYQYFVSTPLKRGKRPQSIRYLYRPMVRSLNNSPTSSKHTRKTKKNQLGQVDAENNKKSLRVEHALPLTLNTSTELSNFEPGPDLKFGAPPLKIDAKYKPLLAKLTKMPFPPVLPKEHKTRSDSGDAYLDRLAVPPVWMTAPISMLQSQDSQIHPTLLDYQPNATQLVSKTGAYISYHAPLHIQRMTGGGATDDSNNPIVTGSSFILGNSLPPPTIAAVTYEDIELQMHQHPSHTSKSVSFQLSDPCTSVSNSICFAINKKTYKKKKNNSHGKTKGKFNKSAKITGRK